MNSRLNAAKESKAFSTLLCSCTLHFALHCKHYVHAVATICFMLKYIRPDFVRLYIKMGITPYILSLDKEFKNYSYSYIYSIFMINELNYGTYIFGYFVCNLF